MWLQQSDDGEEEQEIWSDLQTLVGNSKFSFCARRMGIHWEVWNTAVK